MQDPIVIVGGGAAGLGAAAKLARQGLPVTLVDAQDTLGGHGTRWACMATARCQGCGVCLVHDALEEVKRSPLVQMRLNRRVVAAQASGEAFLLHLETTDGQGREAESLRAAGVVMATGFLPHSPGRGRPQGAADHPGVLTTAELNDTLRTHRLDTLPFAGGDSLRLAFLHCIGSRDPAAARGYCSQVCCGSAFRMARRLRHLKPGWQITLFYIDLQIHGKEARHAWAEDRGIRLIQGVPAEIRPPRMTEGCDGEAPDRETPGTETPDGKRSTEQPTRGGASASPPLELVYQDAEGNLACETFDGALLVVGMEPTPGLKTLADGLGLPLGESGFLGAPAGGDPRILAAGACLGPTSIESSLLMGQAAAARIQAALPRIQRSVFPVPTGSASTEKLETPPRKEEPSKEYPANRTLAVVGRGDSAARLVTTLEAAGLRVRWIRTAHREQGEATEHREQGEATETVHSVVGLTGTVGDFRLRLESTLGQEEVHCGALVLCGDLPMPRELLLRSASGEPDVLVPAVEHLPLAHVSPNTHDETGRLCLWLDPQGPAWRPVASALLAELATLAQTRAEGLGHITLMLHQVALPGLQAQAHYDRARRAGMRVLRLGESPPHIVPQGEGWVLETSDALVPEVPLRLRVERLLGASRPVPPGPVARALGLLPDAEGFAPRANVRLAPLRSERTGVYVCGAPRGEALGEEIAAQGHALVDELLLLLSHDRPPPDHRPAEIDPTRCVLCLSCVRSCPHQAIPMPAQSTPVISPQGCQACGHCLALCPALAIRVQGSPALPSRTALFTTEDRDSLTWATLMRKAEATSDTPLDTPLDTDSDTDSDTVPLPHEIPCFACSQGGAPALRQALTEGRLPGLPLKLHEVPCIGAVGELALMSTLMSGTPRVLLLGCHPGSCAHVDGEALCALRVTRLRRSLADMGVSPKRLRYLALAPAEAARLADLLREELTEELTERGQS